jgi:hypothetical protein
MMAKSLGDFRIQKSSSSDTNNIKWTQKNPFDTEKLKRKNPNKKTRNSSATNIIYSDEIKPSPEKIFKIDDVVDDDKTKKKNPDKRFQNSSASNCNIQQGFERPAR